MKNEHEEILEIEKRFWKEMDSPEMFKESLADDALSVMEPMGFIEKNQAVEMSSKSKRFKDVEMDDVHFRDIAPDCVALAYHGKGMQEGADKPFTGTVSSVYVKRNGRWQVALAVHQPWKPEEKEQGRMKDEG
jgi:hypothetical protein